MSSPFYVAGIVVVVPQFLGLDYGAVDLILQFLITFQKLFMGQLDEINLFEFLGILKNYLVS